VASWHNESGRPLADEAWLTAHHEAKLPERTAFARMIADFRPSTVVDLGCATGLWLDLLNQYLPPECEFVGIDSDLSALAIASERSKEWRRTSSFEQMDIERDVLQVPRADVTLAFNIFPYVNDLFAFLGDLQATRDGGMIAVRQYDGGAIRFGPMETEHRQDMESALRVALQGSEQFHHYDLDRTIAAIHASPFSDRRLSFELFERHAPFPDEFIRYYDGTLEWTRDLLSDTSRAKLADWMAATDDGRYFYEVDLVALLS
jgi:SAM-dependent methyltransferase